MGFLNLFKVKPELSEVDPSKMKIPFISDAKLVDFDNQLFNLTIFNGKPVPFKMFDGSTDE